ncbi:glutamyl-tRNA reductase [Natronospora cellulosivora (SeqCode)]
MHPGLITFNYENTPLEFRERIKFNSKDYIKGYQLLKDNPLIQGSLMLSTCNRTEIYFTVNNLMDYRQVREDIFEIMKKLFSVSYQELEDYAVYKKRDKFFEHLFYLTAGLLSQVIGEQQILGQVKYALQLARDNEASDRYINKLFQKAIASAKEIRHITGLSEKNLSLSSVCVKYIENSFANLNNKKILVIGVGKMSRIVLELLQERGVSKIYATNRTHGKLVKVSDYFDDLNIVSYDRIHELAAKVDIIISSTSSPHYILKEDEFAKYYKEKKLSIFDLGVPRDIDPALAKYNQIDLYNIDMLVEKVKENKQFRQQEAEKAKELLEKEIAKIEEWYSWQEVVPLIKKIKETNLDIIKKENQILFEKLDLDQDEKEEIDKYSKRLEKELFNKIILNLKEVAKENKCEEFIDTFSTLLD